MEDSQAKGELEAKVRDLMSRIRRADEVKKAQELKSDEAREELRRTLMKLGVSEFTVPAINRGVKMTDDYSYLFKVAEILNTIPADDLIKTKAVGFKSEGFDKLARINADWAKFRESVKKAEQKLTITKLDSTKP
jgi:uncharacterized protein YpuA (DUF1002 family)